MAMARIFDGKKTAETIYQNLSAKIKELKSRFGQSPQLAAVLVGDDVASKIYIRQKQKVCERLGIISKTYKLAEKTKEEELMTLLNELNNNRFLHAILVQFPLPKHLNESRIMRAISPKKDADAFNPLNLGELLLGNEKLAPCTAKAVLKILEESGREFTGSDIVIINHSNVLGKPLSLMLLNRHSTVDICHSRTRNLKEHTEKADVVISAVGIANLIKGEMIKKGAVIIDVGISRLGGKILGDVDFAEVKDKACFLTPVPGGVGPMTVAMLMENTVLCYEDLLLQRL